MKKIIVNIFDKLKVGGGDQNEFNKFIYNFENKYKYNDFIKYHNSRNSSMYKKYKMWYRVHKKLVEEKKADDYNSLLFSTRILLGFSSFFFNDEIKEELIEGLDEINELIFSLEKKKIDSKFFNLELNKKLKKTYEIRENLFYKPMKIIIEEMNLIKTFIKNSLSKIINNKNNEIIEETVNFVILDIIEKLTHFKYNELMKEYSNLNINLNDKIKPVNNIYFLIKKKIENLDSKIYFEENDEEKNNYWNLIKNKTLNLVDELIKRERGNDYFRIFLDGIKEEVEKAIKKNNEIIFSEREINENTPPLDCHSSDYHSMLELLIC